MMRYFDLDLDIQTSGFQCISSFWQGIRIFRPQDVFPSSRPSFCFEKAYLRRVPLYPPLRSRFVYGILHMNVQKKCPVAFQWPVLWAIVAFPQVTLGRSYQLPRSLIKFRVKLRSQRRGVNKWKVMLEIRQCFRQAVLYTVCFRPCSTVHCIYGMFPPLEPGQNPGQKDCQKSGKHSSQESVQNCNKSIKECPWASE